MMIYHQVHLRHLMEGIVHVFIYTELFDSIIKPIVNTYEFFSHPNWPVHWVRFNSQVLLQVLQLIQAAFFLDGPFY